MNTLLRFGLSFGFTALAVAIPLSASAQDNAAPADDDGGMKLALSIERLAGISYAKASPDNQGSGTATFVTLGGVLHDPLSMPRGAFDVYLPNGFGFGAALGFGSVSSSTTSSSGRTTDSGTVRAYVFAPRVQYRIPLTQLFDLVPRLGVTFMGGSVTAPDQQSCGGGGCATISGSKDSLSAIALSPEVLGVIRLTHSFNIIGGLGYDHVVSASATETYSTGDGSGGKSQDAKGSFSALSIWFGLGGYI